MEKPFIINPTLNIIDIKNAIDERVSKIKGVLNCLMFATEFIQGDDELDNNSVYHTLWVIDGFLDEINCLQQKFEKM